MLPKDKQLVLSPYESLYQRLIPKTHFLWRLKHLVDFDFIYEELQDKYCLDNGREAIHPIELFKYLLLKAIYNLSDRDLEERSMYDMSFKYFLDLKPEDNVIHPSTLSKFRKLRLKDENFLDLLISKSVQIALSAGVIKSRNIIVDSTHTESRYNWQSTCKLLLTQANLLRKEVRHFDEKKAKQFPSKIDKASIEEVLSYCQELVDVILKDETLVNLPAVGEKIHLLQELLQDGDEHIQHSKDEDARHGHKSANSSFFGYKTHLAMSDERIITAATITSGEKDDGSQLPALVEKSRAAGLHVDNVIGDTAYSGKENLALAKSEKNEGQSFSLVSKLNPVISNGNRLQDFNFTYNKDAGLFVCPAGHLAISKKKRNAPKNTNKNSSIVYSFDVEKCKCCPQKEGCYKGGKSRSYSVTIKSDLHKDQQAFQESQVFQELMNTRYKIEAKNSEIKHRHGYNRALSSGLFGMEIQGATTLFVVNMKRILRIMEK